MNFDSVMRNLNSLLEEQQPPTFHASWILKNAPKIYGYIQRNIRTENGVVDWDTVTRSLDRSFSKRWLRYRYKQARPYERQEEVDKILNKYRDTLYTFLTQANEQDKQIQQIMLIRLVRISQKGNVCAQRELVKWVTFITNDWIDTYPQIWRWQGYEDEVESKILGCVRCYRYTGSFLGYLFKTLEYSGKGKPPLYSLDDKIFDGKKTRGEHMLKLLPRMRGNKTTQLSVTNMEDKGFAIQDVSTGKLNGLVKNIMSQMGIKDPNEAIRRVSSGEWTLLAPKLVKFPSLKTELKLSDLVKRPYIQGFYGNIEVFSGGVAKPSGKVLTMPYPKPLGKVTSEREILQRFPGCDDLDGDELIEAVKPLAPSFETFLGNMVHAIVESEEGRAGLVSTTVGTWMLGICVKDGVLRVLSASRYSGGWRVYCDPVELGREWVAEGLLLLAKEASAL